MMCYYGPYMSCGAAGWGWGWGWSLMPMLFWLVIVVLFIAFVLRLSRRMPMGPTGWHRQGEDPLGIIKIRYARGEITKEQYDELKKHLQEP